MKKKIFIPLSESLTAFPQSSDEGLSLHGGNLSLINLFDINLFDIFLVKECFNHLRSVSPKVNPLIVSTSNKQNLNTNVLFFVYAWHCSFGLGLCLVLLWLLHSWTQALLDWLTASTKSSQMCSRIDDLTFGTEFYTADGDTCSLVPPRILIHGSS